MSTVSLCMIVKNEAANLEKCVAPLVEFVDEIIIVDTGSTDNTVEIATKLGARVEHFEWVDDFSKARNYSFSFATKEWILWIDADDIISNPANLKPIIEQQQKMNPNVDCIILPYIYNRDEFGNPATTLIRERLLKNNGSWVWERRVHEYLMYPPNAQIAQDESVYVCHEHATSAGAREPKRNLRILEAELEEVGMDKADSRLLAYIGEERRANGDLMGAVKIWQDYLQKSTWDEERYQVMCKMSRILADAGYEQDALKYIANAHMTLPSWPDVYLFYADYFLKKHELDKAIYFADECISKGIPRTVLILNPLDFKFTPCMIKSRAYAAKQDLQGAMNELEKAIQMRPAMELLQERYNLQSAINGRRMIDGVMELSRVITDDKIADFIYALPADLASTQPIQDLTWGRITLKETTDKPIVDILLGQGLEPWNKNTINTTGIGGSETAAAYVAESFVKAGYETTIYGNPPTIERMDGVLYTHTRYFDPKKKRDILIASRIPQVFRDVENCDLNVLYLHDISVRDGLDDKSIIDKIDKFVFVSEYQKKHYQAIYNGIEEEKCLVISNGIDYSSIKDLIKDNVSKRDPLRIIWSSSPDRGLETVLQMFPFIRQKYPKASLHIYYGWDNIDKVIAQGAVDLARFKERIMAMVQQPRVYSKGRVPQIQLHKEMLKSGVWLYPTTFLETNCITALECRACGVYPIVSRIGALVESVGDKNGVMIEGSPAYPETQALFMKAIDNQLQLSDDVRSVWWSEQLKKLEAYDWTVLGNKFVDGILK